jgi:outer membrane protein OmpA-like peptidoglycan-associated protein
VIRLIKCLAEILKKYTKTYATIEVHTDNTGDEDKNMKLSHRRKTQKLL